MEDIPSWITRAAIEAAHNARRPTMAKGKYTPKVGDWVETKYGKGMFIHLYETNCQVFLIEEGRVSYIGQAPQPALPRIDRTGGKLRIVHPNPYAKWGEAKIIVPFSDLIAHMYIRKPFHDEWEIREFYSKRSNAIRGLARLSMSTGMSFEVEG